jgi:hypothetical protein
MLRRRLLLLRLLLWLLRRNRRSSRCSNSGRCGDCTAHDAAQLREQPRARC